MTGRIKTASETYTKTAENSSMILLQFDTKSNLYEGCSDYTICVYTLLFSATLNLKSREVRYRVMQRDTLHNT